MEDRQKILSMDLERWLAPITVEQPAGASLRDEGTYDKIRQALANDDDQPKDHWEKKKIKRSDWALTERLCLDALGTRTKDLKISGWLLEAWTHRYGVAGCAQGLKLIRRLCESFWQHLYPTIEGEDLSRRLVPFSGIDKRISCCLRKIPLTRPEIGDGRAFSVTDWERIQRDEMRYKKAEKKRLFKAEYSFNRSDFNKSLGLTSDQHLRDLHEDLTEAREALQDLRALLLSKCGEKAPSMRKLAQSLESLDRLTDQFLKDRKHHSATDERPEEPIAGTQRSQGPIQSRAEAYQALEEAADFLLRTEPHSPVPFLIKRAVGWGDMTLQELLPELIQEKNNLGRIFQLLALDKNDQS